MAKKSTNPPIELDGFRHPVTAQVLMMPPADAQAYLDFTQRFAEQFRPAGMLEEQLAQSLADAQWRLNFARALEANALSTEAATYAQSVPTNEPQSHAAVVLARRAAKGATPFTFSLYEQRLNNQFHKNLALLREIQAERRNAETAALERAAQILQMEKAKTSAARPLTYSPADDGFVFSIPQVEAHIRQRDRQRDAVQFHHAHKAAAA